MLLKWYPHPGAELVILRPAQLYIRKVLGPLNSAWDPSAPLWVFDSQANSPVWCSGLSFVSQAAGCGEQTASRL